MEALQGSCTECRREIEYKMKNSRKWWDRTNHYRRYTKETINMIWTWQKNDRGKVVMENLLKEGSEGDLEYHGKWY